MKVFSNTADPYNQNNNHNKCYACKTCDAAGWKNRIQVKRCRSNYKFPCLHEKPRYCNRIVIANEDAISCIKYTSVLKN